VLVNKVQTGKSTQGTYKDMHTAVPRAYEVCTCECLSPYLGVSRSAKQLLIYILCDVMRRTADNRRNYNNLEDETNPNHPKGDTFWLPSILAHNFHKRQIVNTHSYISATHHLVRTFHQKQHNRQEGLEVVETPRPAGRGATQEDYTK
jgi:hypothetical protein